MTHACYLLRSLNPRFRSRFYIGCTTDPRRRLRQHNGELGQGAHLTKAKRPWEMVLCVYGFSSHVNALKFEWAWQHPLESIAVREAARQLPSLKGVPGMITLVCTMVTLPQWNSINLTLQFMLSNLLQYRQGSPPLPPQIRVFVAPIQSLPGKDSQDDNQDYDDLSTCPDPLSQSEQWDGASSMNASTSCIVQEQAVVTELSLTAELHTTHDKTTSSPWAKPKGKKSRKGKTPQGRKGKRGGTHEPSEDPILLELQKIGSGTRLTFTGKGMDDADWSELDDCSVLSDPQMTLSAGKTTCASSGSQDEMIGSYGTLLDVSDLSVGERILLYRGSKEESDIVFDCEIFGASSVKTASNGNACTHTDSRDKGIGCNQLSEIALSYSITERIYLGGASNDRLRSPEDSLHTLDSASGMKARASDTLCSSHASQGEKIVSDDLSSRVFEERLLADGVWKDHLSAMSAAISCDKVCSSRVKSTSNEGACPGRYNQEEEIDNDEVSEEIMISGSFAEWTPSDQPSKTIVTDCNLDGDSRTQLAAVESRVIRSERLGGRIGSNEVSDDLSCRSTGEGMFLYGALRNQLQTALVNDRDKFGASGMRVSLMETACASSSIHGERTDSFGVPEDLPCRSMEERIRLDCDLGDQLQKSILLSSLEIKRDSGVLTSSCRMDIKAAHQGSDSGDSDIEEISLEEFQRPERPGKDFAKTITRSEAGNAVCSLPSDPGRGRKQIRVGNKNAIEEKSAKGIKLQQISLPNVFPVKKNASVPTTIIHRKARNGEMYKVLEDHSNARNVPAEMGTKGSCVLQDLKSLKGDTARDAVFVIDSDDDEIQEISVNDFQHSSLLGMSQATRRNGRVCSLSNLR